MDKFDNEGDAVAVMGKHHTVENSDKKDQNGFEVDHSKENGNCIGILNTSSPYQSDAQSDSEIQQNDVKNQNGEGHIEKENDISTTDDKKEDDMDNSTATSNLSDISPYEDSEKSMDTEEKVDVNTKDMDSRNLQNSSEMKQMDTGSVDDSDLKPEGSQPTENIVTKEDESKTKHDLDSKMNKSESVENPDSNGVDATLKEKEGKEKETDENLSQGNSDVKELDNDDLNNEMETETQIKNTDKNDKDNTTDDKTETQVNTSDDNKMDKISEDEKELKQNEVVGAEKQSSEKVESESSEKSIDKVTDVDGSEILITLNQEDEESDQEEEKTKQKQDNTENKTKEKQKQDNTENKTSVDGAKTSPEVVVVNESPEKSVTSKVNPDITVVKVNSVQPSVAPVVQTQPVRLPVLTGAPVQYFVSSAGLNPNPQKQYINVNGQQILIQLPPAVSTTSAISSQLSLPTFPAPNPSKDPWDKTVDVDVPQSSLEQIEMIKHEVQQRKPDNAFWGGLANVNKRADLSYVSKFLFDLGSDIVKESAYEQIVQVQKRKEDSNLLNNSEKESLQRMQKVVEELKDKLKYLHDLPALKCKCGFSTDSANVMYLHKQYPHTSDNVRSCPHCAETFDGRTSDELFKIHMEMVHKIKPLRHPKTSIFPCNMCAFDCSGRGSITKHKLKCIKNFKPQLNQAPHHVDINLCLKNIFYKFQVNNRKLQQFKVAAVERPDTRNAKIPPIAQKQSLIQPRPPPIHPIVVNPHRPIIPPQFQSVSGVSPANSWQTNYTRMLATPGNFAVNGPRFAQIQRAPPPLKPSILHHKPTVNQLLRTQQPATHSTANRTGFEVCEICGGYVKDRMSLRIHFFYAHKIEMPAHVFSKPLAPLFCNTCNERFWTSQGFAKHKTSTKHAQNIKAAQSTTNQCWICHQKPENLYSHLHKFHRLTTGECMALKRCMFCGIQSPNRKELELHMAGTHGVLIKGEDVKNNMPVTNQPGSIIKSIAPQNVSTKNLSTVVTGGSTGMVRNNFCVFCSAQFADNTKLTLHCLSMHATCKKCGMVVNKAADLSRHVCKMSSKTCNICGLKNLKPAGLLKHFETHTKPCRVTLKRLSSSQIEKITGRKYPKFDSTASRRFTSARDSRRDDRYRPHSNVPVLNYSNPIKHNHRGKVVIDLSHKLDDNEVVIESDNDSDIIIEEVKEEPKTEIVLDSDDDEKNKPGDSAISNEAESVKTNTGNIAELSDIKDTKMIDSLEKNKSEKEEEKTDEVEGKSEDNEVHNDKNNIDNEKDLSLSKDVDCDKEMMSEQPVKTEKSETAHKDGNNSDSEIETKTDVKDIKNSENRSFDNISDNESETKTDVKDIKNSENRSFDNISDNESETKTDVKDIKNSENRSIDNKDTKFSSKDSPKSRKRSQSDADISDEEADNKKRKTDDGESENENIA